MPSTRPAPAADIVYRTLMSMREPLAVFVQKMTEKAVAEEVIDEGTVNEALQKVAYGKKIAELDTRTVLKLMERMWNPVFFDKPGKLGRSYAAEVHVFANEWAHPRHRPQTFDAERLVDTARRLLIECGVDLPDDLQALYRATRRDSEPQVETEPEVESEVMAAAGVEDLVRRFTVLEERLANLSAAVAHGNDTLAALLERPGYRTSQPGHSEPPPEACTDRQAAKIFRLLVELEVNTADDDAVRDALDDRGFDGSLIKTWCQERYTKAEAAKKIKALIRKVSE